MKTKKEKPQELDAESAQTQQVKKRPSLPKKKVVPSVRVFYPPTVYTAEIAESEKQKSDAFRRMMESAIRSY